MRGRPQQSEGVAPGINHDPKGEAGAKKCPLHLLPPVALMQTAWVLGLGALKYGPWNWRSTRVSSMTYVGAIMRHLFAWATGEDKDPESGISHLAHIAANCMILLDAGNSGNLIDDRPHHIMQAGGKPEELTTPSNKTKK